MIIAITGPDGAGKSTLAAQLQDVFNKERVIPANVVAFPTKKAKSTILSNADRWTPWQKASAFFIDFALAGGQIDKSTNYITILDRCWVCTAIYQGFEEILKKYNECAVNFITVYPEEALEQFVAPFLEISDKFFNYQNIVYVFLHVDPQAGLARETNPNYFSELSHGTNLLYQALLKTNFYWREQQTKILTYDTGLPVNSTQHMCRDIVKYCASTLGVK